ncbi:MAG: TetR family transcriptional regulator C-terminal domain-containing protein [Clostridia bacterium]|nr:TetR family transcriptional regulator C-terminal domain-containing protein [Clostridia bacterium]
MVKDSAHHTLHIVPFLLGADILVAVVGIPLGEAVGYILIQVLSIIKDWVDSDFKHPPQEMAEITFQSVKAAIGFFTDRG